MADFKINFSDSQARMIAEFVESDGKEGLSCTKEVIDFIFKAKEEGMDTKSINELFGLEIKTNKSTQKRANSNNNLSEIVKYFNSLDYNARSNIIYKANDLGREILNTLEHNINADFEACEAYKMIKLRPDRFEDKIRFDFQEVHDDVEKAMISLNELRDKLEYDYEKANGETNHTTPDMTEYDLDEIAKQILGMSYEQFISTYDLEFTKSTTINDLTPEQRIVYDKARAYVKAIKKLAREDAQNLRYDNSERLLNETIEYSNSFIQMIDFETEDITENSIRNLSSGIMKNAFISTVFDNADNIKSTSENSTHENIKIYDRNKGKFYIRTNNGSLYNISGTKEK